MTDAVSRRPEHGAPSDDRPTSQLHPSFVVWLTLIGVGFAAVVALWMYWISAAAIN